MNEYPHWMNGWIDSTIAKNAFIFSRIYTFFYSPEKVTNLGAESLRARLSTEQIYNKNVNLLDSVTIIHLKHNIFFSFGTFGQKSLLTQYFIFILSLCYILFYLFLHVFRSSILFSIPPFCFLFIHLVFCSSILFSIPPSCFLFLQFVSVPPSCFLFLILISVPSNCVF